MITIRRNTAEEITGSTYPQVVNIPDLKNVKKIIFVRVDERESILLQYYLFFHGWRTVERKSYENKPWKIKSVRKSKFKFESIACTAIVIRTDGTFIAPVGGHGVAGRNEIEIKFAEVMEIMEKGYCEVAR